MEFKSTKIILSTPSQTAWALLSLMAGGEPRYQKRRRILIKPRYRNSSMTRRPLYRRRVSSSILLKYWGYFLLLALARYYNLINGKKEVYGI